MFKNEHILGQHFFPRIQFKMHKHYNNKKIDINSIGIWHKISECFEMSTIELRNWPGIWIMALCCYFSIEIFKTGFIPALFKRKKNAVIMLCVAGRCYCIKRFRIYTYLIVKLVWLLAHRHCICFGC